MKTPAPEGTAMSNVELLLAKLHDASLAHALVLAAHGKEGETRNAALRKCLEARRRAIRESMDEEGTVAD